MGTQGKFKKVVISGDPHSRGVQYGKKARPLIEKAIGIYQRVFLEESGVAWEKAIDFSKRFTKGVKNYDEGMVEEIKGIGEGAGRSFEEIMTINLRTEILNGLKRSKEGCTSFCALPEITRQRKTLLAQNWDYKPWAAETMLLLQVHCKEGPDILTIVEAGQLARFGMNSAGIGICNNFIQCETDGRNMEKGVPTTFIRRKALEHEKYYDVLGTILHTPRSFSANYLIATAEDDGDAINIEATPETAYFLFPKEGLITHSNHFKGGGPGYVGIMRRGIENSIYRDRRAEQLLRKKNGKIGAREMMEVLKDHFGHPRSICRHTDGKKAWKDQWRTNASVIMDLKSKVLWLTIGPPCEHAYQRFTFDVKE